MSGWLRVALAGLALCTATGCAPTFAAGGALRLEQLQPQAQPAQQVTRVDARATAAWREDAGTLRVAVSPTLVTPMGDAGTPRSVLRAEAQLAAPERARVQPSLQLAGERGQTRSVELGADPLDPRPTIATLTTERYAAGAALRLRQAPHRTLALQLDVSRNGGVGGDATALPTIARAAIAATGRADRSAARTLGWRVGAESVQRDTDAPWRTLRTDVEWAAQRSRRDRVSLVVGAVQTVDDARRDLRLVLGWRHGSRPGGLGWDMALEQAPELDRLDGSLRTRRRARLTMERTRVSGVSIRGTLQGIADAATANARRGLSGEVGLRQGLGGFGTLEADVAHVLLWEGQGTRRSESRVALGFRLPLR